PAGPGTPVRPRRQRSRRTPWGWAILGTPTSRSAQRWRGAPGPVSRGVPRRRGERGSPDPWRASLLASWVHSAPDRAAGIPRPRCGLVALDHRLPVHPAVDRAVPHRLIDRDHVRVLGRVPGVEVAQVGFRLERAQQVLHLHEHAEPVPAVGPIDDRDLLPGVLDPASLEADVGPGGEGAGLVVTGGDVVVAIAPVVVCLLAGPDSRDVDVLRLQV